MSLESRPPGWGAPWKAAIASAIPGAVAVVFWLPIAFNVSGALTPFLAEGVGSLALHNSLHMLRHVLALGLYGLLTPAVSWRMTDHSVVAAGAITGRQQQALRLLSVAMVGLYSLEFVVQMGWVAPSSGILTGLGTGLLPLTPPVRYRVFPSSQDVRCSAFH